MPRTVKIGRVGGMEDSSRELVQAVEAEARARVKRMAEATLKFLRAKVSRPGPQHSNPGEYPRSQSGALARGYALIEEHRGNKIRLVNTTPQSRYMQNGVRGGKIITPKRAALLAWLHNGQRRFARHVRQGRIAPRPHLTKAVNDMQTNYQRIIGTAWTLTIS